MRRTAIGYPIWKELVPDEPSTFDVQAACREMFGCPAQACKIVKIEIDDRNGTLEVKTPSETYTNGGIMCEYTDNPIIHLRQSPIYCGAGIPRNKDVEDQWYYLLDNDEHLPHTWSKVYASEVIRRHIVKNKLKAGQFILS